MNIIVTGGAGHIGSHLIDELDGNIISLDNGFNAGEYRNPKAKYVWKHTQDIDTLDFKPDIVYHLGEYARITPSFTEPDIVYDMNIIGTFAIVEYCIKHKCKLVYGASSTRFVNPNESPYSFTKATNIELIKNYGKWYGLEYAICYFYNAFGEREKGDGDYATLIAKFIKQYKSGEPLTIVRPGTQKRHFTYVKDIARGIKLVGEKGDGDGYALNNSRAYSVKDIAEAFNGKIKYIDGFPGRSESGDMPDKAYKLGWKPTTDVLEYINRYLQRDHERS